MNNLSLNTVENKDRNEISSASRTQESRAMAEIQAAILMAKHAPRNESQCFINIIEACKRPMLAESAQYTYPRGGQLVKGPSIRLAEVLARAWGNVRVGITITTQDADKTEARAYAFDMQTNYMIDQDFVVPHKRTTKKGVTKLTDERDIRELVQNIGSRYLRGCILRLIPGDVVESALEQVEKTLLSSDVPIAERIKRMVVAFSELGVGVEHIEKRLGHNLDATIPAELVTLQTIFKTIKDGMADRSQFFDIKSTVAKDNKDELMQLLDSSAVDSDGVIQEDVNQ